MTIWIVQGSESPGSGRWTDWILCWSLDCAQQELQMACRDLPNYAFRIATIIVTGKDNSWLPLDMQQAVQQEEKKYDA